MHTLLTLGALAQNELARESDLIIYADAAKKSEDTHAVHMVRKIIRQTKGFKTVKVHERSKNAGLSKSIIEGVTEILNQNDKAIILEDDLVTSPSFLSYMNAALNKYQDAEDVISIHGYTYPISEKLPETYFLRGADCWGWGTWKRGWDLFESDGLKLKDDLIKTDQMHAFNFNDSYPYGRMLDKQIAGKNDSWAIRWYASAFLKNKLTLYPGKSLVQNFGLDLSGTHSGRDKQYWHEEISLDLPELSENIKHNVTAFNAFCHFFTEQTTNQEKLKRLLIP